MSVTIVVAGNRDIFGQGLRLLLEGQEDFRVIAEATTGLKAGQLVQVLQPNVLVVDFMMSDLSSLEVTQQVRCHSPATHVVILSVYSDDAHVLEALYSGVCAYVLRESSPYLFVSSRARGERRPTLPQSTTAGTPH